MDTRKLSVKEISAKCLIEFQPTESTQGAGLLQGFLSHRSASLWMYQASEAKRTEVSCPEWELA